jgi:anhydro-N-acetylmuramic acid kinase
VREYLVTGVMSGSSLDGVDLALCRFLYDIRTAKIMDWSIVAGETIPFPTSWKETLKTISTSTSSDLMAAHAGLGRFIGEEVAAFHERIGRVPDYVASHGHTVFHEPNSPAPFTTQIGDGAAIAVACNLPVICDFRSTDIAAGGQGAPMAPLADLHLFPEFEGWLNIGGITNISLRSDDGTILAFDICGANQILNALAAEAGQDMDRDGAMAATGKVNEALLELAAADPWLRQPGPRSLSNQQVQQGPVDLFCRYPAPLEDRLATAVAYISQEISFALPLEAGTCPRLLVTGGGVYNKTLFTSIVKLAVALGWTVEKPADLIISYKEGLLIALAGLFRILSRPNFIATATGAHTDVCGGAVYLPGKKYLR